MKKFQLVMLAALITGFTACQKKNDVTPSGNKNNTTAPKKSKMELMTDHNWILDETYEDGVRKTSGGTDQYQYTRQGKFKFLFNGTWSDLGTYSFTSKDSTAIQVTFMGSGTPIIMAVKTLDENSLKTEFVSGGKKLNYNYKK